ncbi:multiheme c-type cytochrome [Shewanella donghaensis]|uniref:multiheme c-type cytochrome n=1 Tax=Shewanella donghaensis TaxID=238836 RepID=UPI001182D994|nr:cytochrome c3 family protein [Shewanella donghaensis]
MKNINKCRVAFAVIAAMGLSACSDGDDGKDGLPGDPGIPWEPPVITTSAVAKVLSWEYGSGVVNVEFSVINQDGIAVEDLDRVQLFSTIKNDAGLLADTVDVTYFEGEDSSAGTLSHNGEGIYSLVMPQDSATESSIGTGYIRPGNGNNGMPRTKRVMFTKTDQYAQVTTTDDAKCVSCHGAFEEATGNSVWGWHQHHHALDNEQEIVIVEACIVCHTQTEQKDGGWAENTMAMFGHGKLADGEGGKNYSGHSALWSNYSMDMKRCSTCHMDDVEFTASINGCASCHTNLQDPDREGAKVDHSTFTEGSCISCHNIDGFYYEHENATDRDEALSRYTVEIVSVLRNADDDTKIEVTVKATDIDGKYVDLTVVADSEDTLNGWATVMKNGEAMLPGRDEGHVARATGVVAGDNDEYIYTIEHALPYVEGEVLFGGIDGRAYYDDGAKRAPVTASNINDVRRSSSDGLKCLTCHTEGLDGHGSARGGLDLGGDACVQCHSAYNWAPGKGSEDYAMAWGPLIHNMHFGVYNEERELGNMPTTDRNKPVDCTSCHTGEINLDNVAPATVLNGLDEASVYGITPISANCASCHSGDSAKNHMSQQGGDFNVAITPDSMMHAGEDGAGYAVFDPAVTNSESCSVCHTPARLAEAHQF